MKKKKFKLPLAAIFIPVIILLAISLLLGYIWKVLTTSDFFSVKQVFVRNSAESFEYLKGRNMFDLELNNESAKALSHCPDCHRVRFLRILPNYLIVDFVKRQPVALVKFYKNYAVDQQGVFFNPTGSEEEAALPVIYGLETKIFGPKPGVKYNRPELDLALNIIKDFKANRALRTFTLKRIDVSSLQSAGLFVLLPKQAVDYTKRIPQVEWLGFEVRIGEGNIKQKLMILGGLLMQPDKEWVNIKYIDLRFNEPVIKLDNKN
ncbi:MAG: cell division protein FtsQ/DivIB [Candidatus Omnitrophica bacterium]|nr:cell division protein FtsQ/DivIB [Candidatus Omnitrophota bacterium]